MPTETISERLKAQTRDLHQRAEQGGLPSDLLKGRLPRDRFVAMLEQLLLIHAELEDQIRQQRPSEPRLAALVDDEQFKVQLLRQDLEHLGADPDSATPTGATFDLIARIRELGTGDPLSLIGLHYVLEGSTNGNRFIAEVARQAYRLDGRAGTRYLDPYGQAQRQRWAGFKQTLRELRFSPEEESRVIDSARAMFTGITRVYEDLYPDSSRVVGV